MSRETKKLVVKLYLHDDRDKKKALKTISGSSGIDSVSVDMKEEKLTVTGNIDPVEIVSKLRKHWHTTILTVGAAKEPEKKKEEPKKEEPRKEELKKDNGKKDGGKKDDGKKDEGKKDEGKKKKSEAEQTASLVKAYEAYDHQMAPRHEAYNHQMAPRYYYPPQYYMHSVEENPNACVIS